MPDIELQIKIKRAITTASTPTPNRHFFFSVSACAGAGDALRYAQLNMNEIEFVESIDACFPYDDENEWRKLIQQGVQISDNASFMVLHEICRAPDKVSKSVLLRILGEWKNANTHPLKDELVKVAKKMIAGDVLPCDQVIELMERTSNYKDLYNALAILYFACDDEDGRVDVVYKRIINQWRQA